MQQRLADFPELQRYRDANARLPAAVPGQPRVVFFGDSITEGWGAEGSAGFFPGKGWLNRGISGQTTAQMLALIGLLWRPNLWIEYAGIALFFVAAVLTFWSMFQYLNAARGDLLER